MAEDKKKEGLLEKLEELNLHALEVDQLRRTLNEKMALIRSWESASGYAVRPNLEKILRLYDAFDERRRAIERGYYVLNFLRARGKIDDLTYWYRKKLLEDELKRVVSEFQASDAGRFSSFIFDYYPPIGYQEEVEPLPNPTYPAGITEFEVRRERV